LRLAGVPEGAPVFRVFFVGGASYYGVSDAIALARDPHRFESRWLIGPRQRLAP